MPACDSDGVAAVPLSRSRFIHVLPSGSSSEFVLAKRIREKDVTQSMSKQKVFQVPVFRLCLLLFFLCMRTAGPSETWEQGCSTKLWGLIRVRSKHEACH